MPNGRSDDFGPSWGLDPITGIVIGAPTFVIEADLSKPFDLPPGFDWMGPSPVFGVDYGTPPFASTDTEDPTNVAITPRVPVVTDSDIEAIKGAGPPVQFAPGPPSSDPESGDAPVPSEDPLPPQAGLWPAPLPEPARPRTRQGLIDTRRARNSTSRPRPDALLPPGFGAEAQLGSALGGLLRRLPKIIPKVKPRPRRAPQRTAPQPRQPSRPRPKPTVPDLPPQLPKTPMPNRPPVLPPQYPNPFIPKWPTEIPPIKVKPSVRNPRPQPSPRLPVPRVDVPRPTPAPARVDNPGGPFELPPILRPIPRVPTPTKPAKKTRARPRRAPRTTPVTRPSPWPLIGPVIAPLPFSPPRLRPSPQPSPLANPIANPAPEPMPAPAPNPVPLLPAPGPALSPAPSPLTADQPGLLPFAQPQTKRDRCDCRDRKHERRPSDKVANVKTFRRRMSEWSLKNLNRGRKRGK